MRLPNGYGGVVKLSGKRRKPFAARVTAGWKLNERTGKAVQQYQILGYSETKAGALQFLAKYNDNPIDLSAMKLTFEDIYTRWSEEKYPTISSSNVNGYKASFALCSGIANKPFKDVKLDDLQRVVDTCGKNYPTLRKLLVLFHQIYEYALKRELTLKDYSEFVDILKYKNRNPNKADRDRLTKDEIDKLWTMKNDKYYQIVLMLIYNSVRISELLDLKKENVHLEEQYFDVIDSKTENGIRKVPIANKVLEFYKGWFNDGIDSDYLLHTDDGKHFLYRNYYDSYFKPLMKNLYIERTPHCCRHTCISMLADARVDQTTIKKIVGHAGAMTLTEKVYTHMDIGELVKAINLI